MYIVWCCGIKATDRWMASARFAGDVCCADYQRNITSHTSKIVILNECNVID